MASPAGRCREHGHRAVWFAASQFSNARVRRDREERQGLVHHLAVLVVAATNAVVRIPPAQPAVGSHRAQEWAERLDCRLQECRPNRPDAPVRRRAVRGSVISTGLKKVQ